MYSSTLGALSVKDGMDNINFSSYLRGRMNNHHQLRCYPFRTDIPQRLPDRTINNSQGVFAGSCRPSLKSASFSIPYGRYPIMLSSFNMTAEGQSYFKDHVRHPDDVYLSSSYSATTPSSRQDNLLHASSWPADNNNYTFAPATSQVPMKIDSSPVLPVPGVLPRNVDASKYESLSYDEWSNASVEYDSSSLASSPYYTSSPATPLDTYPEHWSDLHLSLSNPGYTDSSTFRFRPRAITDTANPAGATPTSFPGSGLYTMPSGLSSGHRTFDISLYGYPTYPQLHAQGVIEPSRSPPDVDVETPSEPDDDVDSDDDDALSSISASQPHNYIFSDDEIDDRSRRDDVLLKMRRENYSYREIKQRCGFKEAESTLRGRYRALTKDREERVRRPQWQSKDVSAFSLPAVPSF